MAIYIKQGANIKELHIVLEKFLAFLNICIDSDVYVTSGNDSKHMAMSLHYSNKAVDFGVNINEETFIEIRDEFCKENKINKSFLQYYQISKRGYKGIPYYHVEWDEFGKYVKGSDK